MHPTPLSEPARLEIHDHGLVDEVADGLLEGGVVRVVADVVVALGGGAEGDDEGVGEAVLEALGGVVDAAG